VLAADPDATAETAAAAAAAAFSPGVEAMKVKAVVKKLSKSLLRGGVAPPPPPRASVGAPGRPSVAVSGAGGAARGSVAVGRGRASADRGRGSAGEPAGKGGLLAAAARQANPLIAAALEAVRQGWLRSGM
jgi:hypothetical protein